jgi:hypothetical protein
MGDMTDGIDARISESGCNQGLAGQDKTPVAARRKQLFSCLQLKALKASMVIPWMPRYQTDIMAVAIAYA